MTILFDFIRKVISDLCSIKSKVRMNMEVFTKNSITVYGNEVYGVITIDVGGLPSIPVPSSTSREVTERILKVNEVESEVFGAVVNSAQESMEAIKKVFREVGIVLLSVDEQERINIVEVFTPSF